MKSWSYLISSCRISDCSSFFIRLYIGQNTRTHNYYNNKDIKDVLRQITPSGFLVMTTLEYVECCRGDNDDGDSCLSLIIWSNNPGFLFNSLSRSVPQVINKHGSIKHYIRTFIWLGPVRRWNVTKHLVKRLLITKFTFSLPQAVIELPE